MKTTLLTFVALALLMAPAAVAQVNADLYVIPVAGHTPGAFGSMWMSDVAIQNFSSTALNAELVFIEAGEGNNDNVFPLVAPSQSSSQVTVPAGGNVLLRDVVGEVRETGVIGAILIGSDRPFAVTSRSYSMSPAGDTVGQTVPPVRDFIDNSLGTTNNATAIAYVPGLISNTRFRTNLGFVAGNTSLQPMVIEVMIRDGAGAAIGTRQFVVQSGSFTQLQFTAQSVTGNRSFEIGGAEFRIRAGNGAVVPYASVIDNTTADAVFVAGQFPANAVAAGKGSFGSDRSVFRELFDRFHHY
ncbi:MAG TPA: hypothetical protein VMS98_20515 [Thermoanaerobaculia bacterium]|nr:hypothetical protein [Thermoanaerobaculia bacterium]